MSEFKYPMWFKCIEDGSIFKFVNIEDAFLIDKGLSTVEDEKVDDFVEGLIEHTNKDYWENVTHLYQETVSDEKTSIPSLKKCEHGVTYDTYDVECNKPKQYQIGIDTFERMKANATLEEAMGFIRWNIDKYNTRKKGQDISDYKKIIDYANEAIWWLENKKIEVGDE